MTVTPRLGLDIPQSAENISGYPAEAAQSLGILDNSVIVTTGTLANRPAATTVPAGGEYYATDISQWARSDGTNWHTYLAAGDLRVSAALSAPAGWLLCDGTAYSRTTYAALFAAIGTAYGSGDGSTTFNVPDFRGRAPVGAGQGAGLSSRTRGQTGGEENHTLLAAESGVNGNGTTGDLSFSINNPAGSIGTLDIAVGGGGQQVVTAVGVNGVIYPNQPSSAPLVARNADAAHNNMQPFAVANVFIKI